MCRSMSEGSLIEACAILEWMYYFPTTWVVINEKVYSSMSDAFQKTYESSITFSHLHQRLLSPSVAVSCLFNLGEGPFASLLILISFEVLLNLLCEFHEPLLPSIR